MKRILIIVALATSAIVATIFGLAPYKLPLLADIPFSRAIYDSKHRLLRLTQTQDDKYRLFTPLAQISPTLIQATLLKEDKKFYSHSGINLTNVLAAFWQTYLINEQRRGASTITMQVARLRYRLNTHTISGKIQQILLALAIEISYSKNEILEAYLNLAPYGSNIEGVGAASLIYYHHPAAQLTLPQSLTLSIIPQRPEKRNLNKMIHSALQDARLNLFKRWLQEYPHDITIDALIHLPLSNYTKQQLPFLAPHFVDNLLQKGRIPSAHVSPVIISTLDLQLQQAIEQRVSQYINNNEKYGIKNAAAILIDTEDMSVKALIGSGDYFNTGIHGQVNGTLAKRSPGSTLKPFIYALALEQGLIHPATILKDTPMRFGEYDPENFDHHFLGPITATMALGLSRNIPAIYLANELHRPSFYEFLVNAGLTLRPDHEYGLALVLGGAEISMQQLVEFYAMLANEGVYRPLRFLVNEQQSAGKRLLSAEASYLILDMLQHTPKPPRYNLPRNNLSQPVSWKTGTSSGFRDAWAIGVFDHYVLATWVGNFQGKGNPAFTGHNGAAPLFFNIMSTLPHPARAPSAIQRTPLNLIKVSICSASGMLATHLCPDTTQTLFIPGKSPIKKDTIYREVMINPKTGLRACHFDPDYQFAVFEFWPSDLLALFEQAGIKRRTTPPYDPSCSLINAATMGESPVITSPKRSIKYLVKNKTAAIPLTAIVDADVQHLYWLANETYLGKNKRDEILWWTAKPGKYIVRVSDDYGRSDSLEVVVSNL